MVIINADISHQSRATEPRGKYDARNMALQGNQEFNETNTKPEPNSLQPKHTCLSRVLHEKHGEVEKTAQRRGDTIEQIQHKKCCALLQKIQRGSWVHWIQGKKF